MWVPPTVKISKAGEVIWATGLDQQLSNYYNTGITSLAYLNGVLYAAGKRTANWSSGYPCAAVRPHPHAYIVCIRPYHGRHIQEQRGPYSIEENLVVMTSSSPFNPH